MSDNGKSLAIYKSQQRIKELEAHVEFLEKQLSNSNIDVVATFGAELLNEHEHCFIGGENQIQAICRVVLEQVTQ